MSPEWRRCSSDRLLSINSALHDIALTLHTKGAAEAVMTGVGANYGPSTWRAGALCEVSILHKARASHGHELISSSQEQAISPRGEDLRNVASMPVEKMNIITVLSLCASENAGAR